MVLSSYISVATAGASVRIPTGIYINGEWCQGSGETLKSINPATEEVIAEISTASPEDVDRAVKTARVAFNTTWGLNVPGVERGRLLYQYADVIEKHLDELTLLETADGGKPSQWARSDITSSVDCLRYYAGAADKIHGSTIEVGETVKTVTARKEPKGVVAQIIPWNFPVKMWAWKIAPALAAGCCIIFKPAENTPLTVLRLTELMTGIFPPGVFSLMNGLGTVTGQAIAEHMDIDKIAFTGSTAVGKHIASVAAKSNLKTVSLELGGKSPNIVFESANLQEAARWAAFGTFETSGQSCILGSRVLVQDKVYDEFLKLFVEATKEVKVGTDENAFYGALISKVQFDKVMNYIAIGKKEAKLETGGERAHPKGYYVQPTVFSGVTNDMQIAREEIFGPVVCLIKFSTEEEAIQIANDTEYGLAAGINSMDAAQIPRVSRQLKAGSLWINQYCSLHSNVPFGGYKASGWGRELGMGGLDAYLDIKSTHHYFGPAIKWPFKL